jgi:hypothetical protein
MNGKFCSIHIEDSADEEHALFALVAPLAGGL